MDGKTIPDAMPGWRVLWALRQQGGSLHLSPSGKVIIRPKVLLESAMVREAVQQHLPFLIVAAAIAEVQRMLEDLGRPVPTPSLVWKVAALNEASDAGDRDRTRVEAVRYVEAWRSWVQGGEAHG